MQISKPLTSLMLAGLLGGGLVACGGGSNSSSSAPATETGRLISGTAESVANTVALYENRGALYAIGNFLIPTAAAAITGLMPIQGATVELIRVDDDGKQVGAVLASTTTSLTGDYNLRLPAGIDLAANLVVRITGVSGATLDAQVVSDKVDINPVTDFLLDRLIANGTKLAALPLNEVITLKGHVEAFDLTAGADMAEMLAALDIATGAFIDTSIAEIQNGVGESSLVAGDYHYGEWGISLDDSDGDTADESSVNRISSTLIAGTVSITAAETGKVNLISSNEGADSHFNLMYKTSWPNSLFVENHISDEADDDVGSVDASGAITLKGEFEEEIIPDWYGFRYPASAARIVPLADSGLLMARFEDVAVRYELTADDALDPTAKHGDEMYYGLLLAAKKPTGLSNADLDGDYGNVGIAFTANHDSGVTQLGATATVVNYDGAGNVTEKSAQRRGITRSPGAAPTAGSSTTTGSSTYAVTADGALSIASGAEGFVAEGANALLFFNRDTVEDGATVTSARHTMGLSVKLPVSQPDMSARSYEFINLRLGYRGTGTALTAISGGVIAFNGDGTIELSGKKVRGVARGNDGADIVAISQDVGVIAASQPVTIGSNGSISIPDISTAEGALSLDGFVSDGGKLLVLRAVLTGQSGKEDIGIVVGGLRQP